MILTAHPLDALPRDLTGGAVAIGNFDGVHRGHQVLLARTIADAKALAAKAVVLTFEPNPRTFFRPDEAVFRHRFPCRAHQIPWVRRRTVPNRTHLIVRRLRHLSY